MRTYYILKLKLNQIKIKWYKKVEIMWTEIKLNNMTLKFSLPF